MRIVVAHDAMRTEPRQDEYGTANMPDPIKAERTGRRKDLQGFEMVA
jgi:hypothetical protein